MESKKNENFLIKKIHEFTKGERIENYFLIKTMECKFTNNSTTNKYLDLTLTDNSGNINAKLWEVPKELETMFKENMMVRVRGTVNEYRGKLQLKIDRIRKLNDEDNVIVEDFVPTAPYKSEEMYELLLDYICKIDNEHIRNITEKIILSFEEKLMYYPAAKSNHHAVKGGLLYHVTTMLKAGEALLNIYTDLDKDLLFAGVILHDIAKIYEMDSSDLGIVSQYTVQGQLLGHIVLGINLIDTVGREVNADKEIITLLQHMILTHHYEPEYGSPKKPMIPEAELLHHLDVMDARLYDMRKVLKDVECGEFSERVWSLDNLSIYKSYLSKNKSK
ncbi:3'-5' exoribonuclease YhaM family protein [Clostridium senegalense]|uniref:3'-5' exoribonuclease YhaM family protein n=1 Tax=Clostridium senegalense TaxID=1465809 RepID=UPI0002896225|nr:OB-fold nucleic acid binding domain-containing protein [Clostridium senegalense]